MVTDEFGSVQGLVTLIDVMESIVGDLPEPGDRRAPEATQREDGSWLVDGSMTVKDFRARLALPELHGEAADSFETVGGFVLDRLGRIPRVSEAFEWSGWRCEVVDMDRHRVDKVLVTRVFSAPPAASPVRTA